jgi:hypothetical protein
MQKVVAQHQKATTTGNQARAVQGRSKAGHRQTVQPNEQSITYATVIRHGGLPNREKERVLWAKPPHFLVQAAQRALDRLSRFPVQILHSNWSLNYNQTRNFSYVLAGVILARDLLALKTQLCDPFLGAPTDLVPAHGWSWAQLHNVPTVNEDGNVWTPKDLYNTFIVNPCFQDVLICAPPHWQGNPITSGKETSTVFVAYIDDGHFITQRATNEGVYMFGVQVHFIHCGDSPTLIQCSRCHMISHYATSDRCKAPQNVLKCYRCGGTHDRRKHDYECLQPHKVLGDCFPLYHRCHTLGLDLPHRLFLCDIQHCLRCTLFVIRADLLYSLLTSGLPHHVHVTHYGRPTVTGRV